MKHLEFPEDEESTYLKEPVEQRKAVFIQNMKNTGDPKISHRYAKQENDVVTLIVSNFCNQAQDGVQIQKQIGELRRIPGFEEPRLDSVLAKASHMSDQETERKVEKVVNETMQSSLARIEHLSPRGIEQDYENINSILTELDAQMAQKLKLMSQDDR